MPTAREPELHCRRHRQLQHQANAISSIPAYIARCRFFFALCPVIDCPFQGKVLTPATWSSRGWCRLERAARELSPNNTWILIRSESSLEAIGTMLSFPSGPSGKAILLSRKIEGKAGSGDAAHPGAEAEPLPASWRPSGIPAPLQPPDGLPQRASDRARDQPASQLRFKHAAEFLHQNGWESR